MHINLLTQRFYDQELTTKTHWKMHTATHCSVVFNSKRVGIIQMPSLGDRWNKLSCTQYGALCRYKGSKKELMYLLGSPGYLDILSREKKSRYTMIYITCHLLCKKPKLFYGILKKKTWNHRYETWQLVSVSSFY
jgi:hypothetical protein